MENNTNVIEGKEGPVETKFKAPVSKEDFPQDQKKIEHTYENGNKVVFLLLSNGSVACIREGSGEDVETATMESNGDRASYLTALTASCVKVDGKYVNMYELKKNKMKDYLAIQTEFAGLNF